MYLFSHLTPELFNLYFNKESESLYRIELAEASRLEEQTWGRGQVSNALAAMTIYLRALLHI